MIKPVCKIKDINFSQLNRYAAWICNECKKEWAESAHLEPVFCPRCNSTKIKPHPTIDGFKEENQEIDVYRLV